MKVMAAKTEPRACLFFFFSLSPLLPVVSARSRAARRPIKSAKMYPTEVGTPGGGVKAGA